MTKRNKLYDQRTSANPVKKCGLSDADKLLLGFRGWWFDTNGVCDLMTAVILMSFIRPDWDSGVIWWVDGGLNSSTDRTSTRPFS